MARIWEGATSVTGTHKVESDSEAHLVTPDLLLVVPFKNRLHEIWRKSICSVGTPTQ